jgi:flagellar hook-length control protein FliK
MREATPAVHAPPDRQRPSGRRDHPADGPPDLFAAVLASTAGPPPQAKEADTKARTAHAEGDRAGCDSTGQTESQVAATPTQATPTAAAPAAPAAQPLAQPEGRERSVPEAAAPPVAAAPKAVDLGPQAPAPADAPQAAAPASQVVVAPAAPATDAPAAEAATVQPEAGAQAAPKPAATTQATGNTATAAQAAQAAPRAAGGHTQQHEEHQGHEQRRQPPIATPAEPVAAGARRGRVRGGQHRPEPIASTRAQQTVSPTPAQAEGAAPASEAGGTTHAAAPAQGRVRILELAESMRAVVSVAKVRGSATARITLRPETLGGVQVKLRAGRDGVSAELVADSAHAAQALATAGGDLRRALESQGVNLLGLDVRTAGDGTEAHGHEGRRSAESELMGGQGGMDAGQDPETTIEPSRLPDPGSQVDVLA